MDTCRFFTCTYITYIQWLEYPCEDYSIKSNPSFLLTWIHPLLSSLRHHAVQVHVCCVYIVAMTLQVGNMHRLQPRRSSAVCTCSIWLLHTANTLLTENHFKWTLESMHEYKVLDVFLDAVASCLTSFLQFFFFWFLEVTTWLWEKYRYTLFNLSGQFTWKQT